MNNSYLSFSIDSRHYCVSLSYVKEIFHLPELKPVAELPSDIIGVLNYRNTVLPVLDLNTSLYYTSSYSLTDSVIVLTENNSQVGINVNQVHGIIDVEPHNIMTEIFNLDVASELNKEQYLFTGIANVDSDIVVLSNPVKIIQYINQQFIPSLDSLKLFSNSSQNQLFSPKNSFFAKVTPEEKKIFLQRARSLQAAVRYQNELSMAALAIFELHGELLAIEAEKVKEFIKVGRVTPIPNVSAFIVGNTNLRGEIVTLLDISQMLSINATNSQLQQAAIVEIDDIVVGITFNQIVNINFVDLSTVQSAFVQAQSNGYEYIKGNITEQNKIVKIIDLDKVIKNDRIIIDQAA